MAGGRKKSKAKAAPARAYAADWRYDSGKTPKLAAYVDRVGAEQRNFRRYVVKRDGKNHYHFDATIIRIDGTSIRCPDPEYAPTAEEAAAIAVELAGADFPKSGPARPAALKNLKPISGPGATLFVYYEASIRPKEREHFITFVQERINAGTADKADLPWSYWDDGQWRNMEPDGDLPLYGLQRLRSAPCIFLHEGAKTAAAVHKMVWGEKTPTQLEVLRGLGYSGVAAPGDCPWIAELRTGSHLGWPGGAPNPHRVDWTPIKELPPDVTVYLVCDNDRAGEDAAPLISKMLQRPLKVIRFGQQWPEKFDLADPWPKDMWKEKKSVMVYDGPSFDDCVGPGTWATRSVAVTEKKDKKERKDEKPKFKIELREEFVGEWYACVKPAVFIPRDQPQARFDTDQFNAKVAPYSDVEDVAKLLRKKASAQAGLLAYEPRLTPGRIAIAGEQVINVYQPSLITPIKGDMGLFEEFMAHLIPDENDRNELIRWCATLVARPDIRMAYSVILASQTQGVGKTTLAEQMLAPLVGLSNCSFPTADMILEKFTTWRLFKRLAIIGEIYEGQSANAYNRLKTYITDESIDVREMYEKPYTVANHLHVLASSNSLRPLKIDAGDRRWLVPGVTEDKARKGLFKELRAWLEDGGLSALAFWMRQEKNIPGGYVLPGMEAPMSAAKQATIYAGMSEGEKLIKDFGERLAKMKTLLGDTDRAKDELGAKLVEKLDKRVERLMKEGLDGKGRYVVRLDLYREKALAQEKANLSRTKFGDAGRQLLETPQKIGHLLRQCGLHTYPRDKRELWADGKRISVASTFEIPDGTKWADLKPFELTPDDYKPL